MTLQTEYDQEVYLNKSPFLLLPTRLVNLVNDLFWIVSLKIGIRATEKLYQKSFCISFSDMKKKR